MNFKNHHHLAAVAAGVLSISLLACADRSQTAYEEGAEDVAQTADETAQRASETARQASDAARQAGESISDVTSDVWNDIQYATYEERNEFREGVSEMASNVDAKLEEWSVAAGDASEEGIGELREARDRLRQELAELGQATEENWDQARNEVAEAWQQVEDAYNNLERQV